MSSREDLSTEVSLSTFPKLCSTGPTGYLIYSLHDCIHMGHHMHDGKIPFKQHQENLWSSWLGKTHNYYTIRRLQSLPVALPNTSDHSRVLSVYQVAVIRLGKGSLRISISIMVIRLEGHIKTNSRSISLLSPVDNVIPCIIRRAGQVTHRL